MGFFVFSKNIRISLLSKEEFFANIERGEGITFTDAASMNA